MPIRSHSQQGKSTDGRGVRGSRASQVWEALGCGDELELGKEDHGGGKEMLTGSSIALEMGVGHVEPGKEQMRDGERRVLECWQNCFGSWQCKAAGEGTAKEIPANMKPFTKKRLGGGALASVRVVSSLLCPLIPSPLALEEEPTLCYGEPLCSLFGSYSHWAVGRMTLIWPN